MILIGQPPGLLEGEDQFNRGTVANLGASWRSDFAGQRVESNRCQTRALGANTGRTGDWSSFNDTLNGGSLNTDNCGIEAQLVTPTVGVAANNWSALALAVGDTFASGTMAYCCLSTGQGCGIITCQGAIQPNGMTTTGSGQTIRIDTTSTVALTDRIRFERDDNVFTLYKNNVQLLQWTDTTRMVSTGPSFRRFGVVNEGNRPIFQSEFKSPSFDWVRGYDLPYVDVA